MEATFDELLAEHEALRREYLARPSQSRDLILEDRFAHSDPFIAGSRAGLGSTSRDLFINAGLAWHAARPGSRQHGDYPPFYRTETEHWEIVDVARILEGNVPTATNVLDVLSQFAIFTGFTYKVVPKKDPEDDLGEEPTEEVGIPETRQPGSAVTIPLKKRLEVFKRKRLAAIVQQALDKWMKVVKWYQWEVELFRRTRRDGESFLELVDDELTEVGVALKSIEPEQIREPQDQPAINRRLGVRNPSWKYGILTPRDDTANAVAYWVVSQYADEDGRGGELVEAEDMFHLKTEWVDRMAKRGVSDFFSVANDMPAVKKLLRNLRDSASAQACIAMVVEHPEQSAVSGLSETVPFTDRDGNKTSAMVLDGPRRIEMPFGKKFIQGPVNSQASILIDILQAALRNIGSRWQMPEGLISGDASNANLASSLVTEGPFCRGMTFRQWHYRKEYGGFVERVLDRAAVAGRLGPATETLWDEMELSVECKPVIPRKASEETARNETLSGRGILSDQTWAAREDLDFEDEQANIAEHPTQAQRFEDQEAEAAADGEPGAVKKEPEGQRVS